MARKATSPIESGGIAVPHAGPILHPIIHRGHADMGPALPPKISTFVTASWVWANQSAGNITWTFVNSDPTNSHTVVLYRGASGVPNYIFGGAFWPIYLAAGYGFSMLDGTKPIPTLTGTGGQPMGILDYGAGASPRYLVHFIFTLGPGQTWSTPEGGFTGITPTPGVCYELTNPTSGTFCVGYDPARVAAWDSQTGSTTQGFSPNPSPFVTYAFQPEPTTPENTLGYNDSIASGSCAIQNFYFVMRKNNYGHDEVKDNLDYPGAFYLFLEGYTPNAVGSSTPTFPSGTFNSSKIPGLSISGPTTTYDIGNTGANATTPQRIRFLYEVDFTNASLPKFPAPGGAPEPFTLGAAISILGQNVPGLPGEFFLLGGDDPYFTNVNASAGNQPYLSQDLRVFTITPTGNNQTPIGTTPFTFQGGNPTTFDHPAAYTYIQNLITALNKKYGYLNTTYTPPDTNVSDPLDGLLPEQFATDGDSSVTPKTGPNKNYNFAIARVRLNGSSGPSGAASNVKVFFRLFTTQTFDTDFINSASAVTSADPNVTYPPSGNNPASPLPGTDGSGTINGCSLPFFATANLNANPGDYASGGPNNQTIDIPTGDYAWAFYGCYLNVNDANNIYGKAPGLVQPVQQWLVGASHSCLVAQIAYSQAPIINANGVIENPENSDKLAQRNLQVTTSGNPGFPATHRVPQTIDVRPSPPTQSSDPSSILSYPDEMMIDWGKTPPGSVASIYWPGVSAASVLKLAAGLYPAQTLTASDANTIQCQVTSPVTYIPIPPGAGGSFAGLLTVDLPSTVRYGDEFDIVVRRITTKQVVVPPPPPPPPPPPKIAAQAQAAKPAAANLLVWRYITGSFLVRIPVQHESLILPGDENLLAILKWRLGLIGPGNRWYLVLLRWISYLSGRVDGMGGHSSQIPGSPDGYQQPSPVVHKHPREHREHCRTGKVIAVHYDRFGDFEGFTLLSEDGYEHLFRGREPKVEELVSRVWIDRTVISVCVEPHEPEWPASIVLRRWK
jgi:hypothetical protein